MLINKMEILGVFFVFTVIIFTSQYASGHLDPPGPPPIQDVIWLTSVTVLDDMDYFFDGEISIDFGVGQTGHTPVTGSVPGGTVSVGAPPPTPYPGPFPVVIYNHVNCNPSERPIAVSLTLNDDDLTGTDISVSTIAFGTQTGTFVSANGQFSYTIMVGTFPIPGNACTATGPTTIPTPPAPPTPSPGIPIPPSTPPREPSIPPTLPGDDEPRLAAESFDENFILKEFDIPQQEGLQHSDFALMVGLIVGGIVVGGIVTIIAIIYRRH